MLLPLPLDAEITLFLNYSLRLALLSVSNLEPRILIRSVSPWGFLTHFCLYRFITSSVFWQFLFTLLVVHLTLDCSFVYRCVSATKLWLLERAGTDPSLYPQCTGEDSRLHYRQLQAAWVENTLANGSLLRGSRNHLTWKEKSQECSA